MQSISHVKLTKKDKRKIVADILAGAHLLDEKFPGWTKRIDLDTLEFASPSQCILSQASGLCYFNACDALDLSLYNHYGFNIGSKLHRELMALPEHLGIEATKLVSDYYQKVWVKLLTKGVQAVY